MESGDCLRAEDQHLLLLIASGSSAAEAADELGTSVLDVALCLESIRARLAVSSTVSAVDVVLGRQRR